MNLRPLLFLPPLALGVGGFIWLTSPDEVEVTPPAETATVVRVMTLTPSMAVPTASGYGRVTAEDRWQAISQVEGRVEYVAPGLEIGTVIAEGTEIIRVDPRDYEIALARAEASRGSAQAALDELKATEENTLSTIRLETRIQEVRKAELDRQQALLGRGSAAQASVDTVIRDLLAQEKMVLSLENSLRLLPSQRASLRSTIETRNVEIEEAGRVVASSVTKEQFVRVGDTLAEIESTAASEVTAEFQTRVLGNLFTALEGVRPIDALRGMDVSDAFDVLKRFDLQAEVRMSVASDVYTWPAELIRFDGSADPTTGTVGLVVRIDSPSLPDPDRRGPPLSNGTFVEVRLFAPEPLEALRIPRAAIHTDGTTRYVYVIDGDSRLARRDVMVGPIQEDAIIIHHGLSAQDEIVLSDPRPAVIGMLLEPVHAASGQG